MSRGSAGRAYAGLAWRALRTRLGSTRPFKITISLTNRCDCRCKACAIWQKPKGRELSAAEIAGVLGGAPSIRWVNLTGGEPFLRDDLPEIAEAAQAALPRLAVLDFPTTGQREQRIVEDVARIAELGIPRFYVTVSLEGPPELHDHLRGREGAFERMVSTYAALRQVPGVRVYLGMTLSDANGHLVAPALSAVRARMPAAAGDVGWGDVHLNVYTTSGHYYANQDGDLGRPAALHAAVRRALRQREASLAPTDRLEATYLRLLPEHLRTGRSPLRCRSLRASVFVDAGGDLYPCTVYGRKLGNVLEAPLHELLDTEEARATRAVIDHDACPGCWSPCEAQPTIVASLPESLLRRPRLHP